MNPGVKNLLCVIDIFTKYAHQIPVIHDFINLVNESKRKTNK